MGVGDIADVRNTRSCSAVQLFEYFEGATTFDHDTFSEGVFEVFHAEITYQSDIQVMYAMDIQQHFITEIYNDFLLQTIKSTNLQCYTFLSIFHVIIQFIRCTIFRRVEKPLRFEHNRS